MSSVDAKLPQNGHQNDHNAEHRQNRRGRRTAELPIATIVRRQKLIGQPLERNPMGLAGKAHDLFENTIGVHQMNQGDKNDKRRQMRQNNITETLKTRGPVYNGGLHTVPIERLKTRKKDNKSKGTTCQTR